MKSRSTARFIDWGSASRSARSVGGPGPRVTPDERSALTKDFQFAVERAEDLVAGFTRLPAPASRTRAWIMGRGGWADANLRSLERVIGPLIERLLSSHPSRRAWRAKALGTQLGGLLGYVSRKVVGQYDVFLPADDEGLLYFVGPNVVAIERKFGLERMDFRMWVAIHEVTHRVQFAAAPWLRGYLAGMVDAYLATVDIDSKKMIENLQRAAREMAERGEWRSVSVVLAMMTPEQLAIFHRMQSMMSLLEGHASFVMNQLGKEHLGTFDRLQRGLKERRNVGGMEKTFQRIIGFDQKVKQYGAGEHFVTGVVQEAGMAGLNAVWSAPSTLPTMEEIAEPSRWLARVRPG